MHGSVHKMYAWVSAQGGLVAEAPLLTRMTERCKNITLPQLRYGQ